MAPSAAKFLFRSCEFDYTSLCLSNVLVGYQYFYNLSLLALSYSKPWYALTPFYTINSVPYFWPEFIEPSYCLSLDAPSSYCTSCSHGCSYTDLSNDICSSACNVSDCGFCNLKGLESDGCYSFLLGDGNCDRQCYYDSDCFTSDTCTDGCSYSAMLENQRPFECEGSCFAYCSESFCSPGCSFQDLYQGFCSSACSGDCLSYCSTNVECAPGCLFGDMAGGSAPLHAAGIALISVHRSTAVLGAATQASTVDSVRILAQVTAARGIPIKVF